MTELHDSLSEILLVILSQNSRHIVFTNIYQSQISPADLMKFLHFIVITNRWLINQKWNIFGPNLTNLMEKNTVTLILVVIGSWNLCSLLQFHLCTNTDKCMPAAIYLFLSIRRNKTQTEENDIGENICSCWICSKKMLPCLSLLFKSNASFRQCDTNKWLLHFSTWYDVNLYASGFVVQSIPKKEARHQFWNFVAHR